MNENHVLELPEELRPLLRRPLGRLVKSPLEAAKTLMKRRVVAVGDATAAALLRAGVRPAILVVDRRTLRGPVSREESKLLEEFRGEEIKVENPAGTITPSTWNAFRGIKDPAKILVEGEEDLMAIPAILLSPAGTIVVYGQPGEGIVLVEVTEEKKREVMEILKKFRRREK
ncbi:MAG: GTP-dependent dephospho-CoA kinase family protein [Candidatus Hadarchaeales archaeon]